MKIGLVRTPFKEDEMDKFEYIAIHKKQCSTPRRGSLLFARQEMKLSMVYVNTRLTRHHNGNHPVNKHL